MQNEKECPGCHNKPCHAFVTMILGGAIGQMIDLGYHDDQILQTASTIMAQVRALKALPADDLERRIKQFGEAVTPPPENAP